MGVSIHGNAYKVADVVYQIDSFVKEHGGYREGSLGALNFFHEVANEFGIVLDDNFVLVYNEYYEEYNPDYNFGKAVSTYYFPYVDVDEDYDMYFDLPGGSYFGGGASADEVLEKVFEEEFGYDGKFADRWDD